MTYQKRQIGIWYRKRELAWSFGFITLVKQVLNVNDLQKKIRWKDWE